jgi:hypothetical protein
VSLGTALEADIKDAITNSDNSTTSSNKVAAAINAYLSGAEYGDGALTYSSSVAGSAFKLSTEGTVNVASTKWSDAVMAYWGASATGVVGEPTQEASVVAGTIAGSTVGPSLKASLTSIFNNVGGTADSKSSEIAQAIEDAVATLVVAWTEITPPSSAVPLTGGIA